MTNNPNDQDAFNIEKIYIEVLRKINETDQISFKLLGFLPLVSSGALITLLTENISLTLNKAIFIGLAGALISYFIFRWELRNIQTCKMYRQFASELEEKMGLYSITQKEVLEVKINIQGKENDNGWGKSEAEKGLYWTIIIFWLAFPVFEYIATLTG